jgi:hypothetical protein
MNSTSPIERLNYFNGQRLEAADFRLEQEFHMRVRRVLNKSLYTPGIAAGLEVEKVLPEPSHFVRVLPGLALDSLGREIILVEPVEVPVSGKPTEPTEPVTGNYLVIEYAEESIAFAGDGCAVQLGVTCKATEDLAWGAPSRIRAEPNLYIQHQWPKIIDNKIVLAQLELNKDCSVRDIRTFVRKYVAAAKEAKARALALEGEKDLDKDNPKELYFHIVGGTPDSALLYLRATRFSTLFYTELGSHTHELTVKVEDTILDFEHKHTIAAGKTKPGGGHGHDINIDVEEDGDDPAGVDMQNDGLAFRSRPIKPVPDHFHEFEELSTNTVGAKVPHGHTATGTAAATGTPDRTARTGGTLKFVNELRVKLDKADITPQILTQLNDRDGGGWAKLGDGTSGHKLVVEGTREIDLLRLGVDLAPGEHRLEFGLATGGGEIQYNLYIE